MKYLGINLSKEATDLDTKTIKLMKQIETTQINENITSTHTKEDSTAKLSTLSKVIYRFHVIPIKILTTFFIKMEKKILNSMKLHRTKKSCEKEK